MGVNMAIPGALYSLLMDIGVWAIDYFSGGAGASLVIAPIIVAAVPIILKMFTVQGGEEPATRGMGGEPARSKLNKFIWG